MIKNVYLLLVGSLLIGISGCHKNSVSGGNSGNVTDTTSKVVNPNGKDLPAGATDGVTFINNGTSAIFDIYAPNKKSFYLVGDFNNWSKTATPMYNTKDGTRWWVQVDNLNPNTEYSYQYYIDGSLTVADPYCHKILDKANDPYIPAAIYPNPKTFPTGASGNIVSDFWYGAPTYSWKNSSFTKPDPKNLVVYELLMRDFVATHSYKTLLDTLNYIKRLGVNAIEFLPVNEFEGNDSWGYNSNFMFALDKYYGTPNDYKAIIDACHTAGMAVIMDIVLEDQFGSSPMVQMYWDSKNNRPAANSPWFDPVNLHPADVGYQLNHSLAATQYFTENVMKYWLQEYHIDGYRFDEAKGYTQVNSGNDESGTGNYTLWGQYDQTRVDLWTKYYNYMKTIDPNVYTILEMFSDNSEEAKYVSQGMMVWNNQSSAGEQCTMGYPSNPSWDISGIFSNAYGFPNTAPSVYGLMSYFESHDQERLQFKNEAYGNSSGTYNVKNIPTGLSRDGEAIAFLLSSPGPKMVWMGGEVGYDVSIDGGGGRLSDKPFNWDYPTQPARQALYAVYQKMIRMKIRNPVFATTNFTYNLSGPVKSITLLDATANVEVVGNFDVVNATANITFPSAGTWYDNISGNTLNVTSTTMQLTLAPGEYHIYSSAKLQQ